MEGRGGKRRRGEEWSDTFFPMEIITPGNRVHTPLLHTHTHTHLHLQVEGLLKGHSTLLPLVTVVCCLPLQVQSGGLLYTRHLWPPHKLVPSHPQLVAVEREVAFGGRVLGVQEGVGEGAPSSFLHFSQLGGAGGGARQGWDKERVCNKPYVRIYVAMATVHLCSHGDSTPLLPW